MNTPGTRPKRHWSLQRAIGTQTPTTSYTTLPWLDPRKQGLQTRSTPTPYLRERAYRDIVASILVGWRKGQAQAWPFFTLNTGVSPVG